MKNLFVNSIRLRREKVEDFDKYPFSIPLIKDMKEIVFRKNVTFLVGENGVGKSTLIEALAVALSLNAEGGSQNMRFVTYDSTSQLSDYLAVAKTGIPRWKYFLRAETFYTMANAYEELDGRGMHEKSHGEEFLEIFNRFSNPGLYLLDEPESALSPKNQMRLLCLLDDMAKKGSQFIIATHSPILISYREGEILDLNGGAKKIKYEDTEIYRTYKRFLDCPERMQHLLLDNEEG